MNSQPFVNQDLINKITKKIRNKEFSKFVGSPEINFEKYIDKSSLELLKIKSPKSFFGGKSVISFEAKWSKIVKDKPINIRLYELIYFELLNLWIEMKKPPLRILIYHTINSKNYEENFIRGKIFQEYINEVLETPCEDESGYYNPDSREILSKINIKELYDIKFLIKDELNTVIMIDRYNAIYSFCKIYESWCLEKKSKL
mgnify:CR=1 FL=1